MRSGTHAGWADIAYPAFCPYHPSPMLIDLQQLDIDPGYKKPDSRQYNQSSSERLRHEVASKRMFGDDDGSRTADQR